MRYDGLFLDSGNTIYGFGQETGDDPTAAEVARGEAERATAALGWLGHTVDADRVADVVAQQRRKGGPSSAADWTEESLVGQLFAELELPPRPEDIVYVTGVLSGPRYRSWTYPNVHDTLQTLTEAGLYIGLIANTSVPGWVMDRNFRGVGVFDYLGARVYSGDEGVQKPDPAIFRIAEQRCGLSPDRLIYMGDKVEADVVGATAAGWSSILFRSVQDGSDGAATFEIDDWSELPALLLG